MLGPENQAWSVAGEYRPLAYSIGLFEYQGGYYFDAFMDHDFSDAKPQAPKYYQQYLYAIQRKVGQVERVCQFKNMDSKWERQYE
jgi:hypothetical protein